MPTKIGDFRIEQLNEKCWAVQQWRGRIFNLFPRWAHACWTMSMFDDFPKFHETKQDAKDWLDRWRDRQKLLPAKRPASTEYWKRTP